MDWVLCDYFRKESEVNCYNQEQINVTNDYKRLWFY